MAKGGFRPGGGRPPLLNPDGSRKHPVRIRKKPGATPTVTAATPARPPKRPAAPPVNPFMSVAQALKTPVVPPPDSAMEPFPVERPDLPVATAADVPGGMPDLPLMETPDPSELENLTPLQYMLREMNWKRNDPNRRDKMAVAAAPFVHARAGEKGKKEAKEAAAKESAGKFGARPPPLRAVS